MLFFMMKNWRRSCISLYSNQILQWENCSIPVWSGLLSQAYWLWYWRAYGLFHIIIRWDCGYWSMCLRLSLLLSIWFVSIARQNPKSIFSAFSGSWICCRHCRSIWVFSLPVLVICLWSVHSGWFVFFVYLSYLTFWKKVICYWSRSGSAHRRYLCFSFLSWFWWLRSVR